MSEQQSKHVIAVTVRSQFAAAIKTVADLEMCSISDLFRRTMMAKCREYGIDPIARQAEEVRAP
jgi:hypothetical protein